MKDIKKQVQACRESVINANSQRAFYSYQGYLQFVHSLEDVVNDMNIFHEKEENNEDVEQAIA